MRIYRLRSRFDPLFSFLESKFGHRYTCSLAPPLLTLGAPQDQATYPLCGNFSTWVYAKRSTYQASVVVPQPPALISKIRNKEERNSRVP